MPGVLNLRSATQCQSVVPCPQAWIRVRASAMLWPGPNWQAQQSAGPHLHCSPQLPGELCRCVQVLSCACTVLPCCGENCAGAAQLH